MKKNDELKNILKTWENSKISEKIKNISIEFSKRISNKAMGVVNRCSLSYGSLADYVII